MNKHGEVDICLYCVLVIVEISTLFGERFGNKYRSVKRAFPFTQF